MSVFITGLCSNSQTSLHTISYSHTHTHTSLHTISYSHTHTHTHTRLRTISYSHTHTHTHTHRCGTPTQRSHFKKSWQSVNNLASAERWWHSAHPALTYTHTHTHRYTHTHTHTNTHTHTLIHLKLVSHLQSTKRSIWHISVR